MTVMSNAERLQAIDSSYYYYYYNQDSATNNEQIEDIVRTAYRGIEFGKQYPLFAFRMDSLVLWFVEKLLWRRCYKEACRILMSFKPEHYKMRPWPTIWMVKVSRYSIGLAVVVWTMAFPVYLVLEKFGSLTTNVFKQKK
jgi:hypothetical protein